MVRLFVILVALLVPSTAFAQAGNPGGWGQLSGDGTCLASGSTVEGCPTAPALYGLQDTAITPDGTQVLAVSGTDRFTYFGHGDSFGALVVFDRNKDSGALTFHGCFSSDTSDGMGGGGCDPATAIDGASAVAVAPDGSAVAVAARGSGSITVFKRDAATGDLTELGCYQQGVPLGGKCRPAPVIEGIDDLAFTADGRDLLAIAPAQSALVDLHQPDVGPATVACLSATGTSGSCTRVPRLAGVSAMANSADGHQVYLRTAVGVVWLTRDPVTGALSEGGCVDPQRDSCRYGRAPYEYYDYTYDSCCGYYLGHGGDQLVLSPDGRSLYTQLVSTIDAFNRDDDGSLRPAGCYVPLQETVDESGDVEDGGEDGEDSGDGTDPEARAAQDTRQCTQVEGMGYFDRDTGGLAIPPDGGSLLLADVDLVTVLNRASDGTLSAGGCLSAGDSRCGSAPQLVNPFDVEFAPDGSFAYVGASQRIVVLGRAPALSRATGARAVIACRRGCRGTVRAVRLGAGLGAVPVAWGTKRSFRLRRGQRARIHVAVPRGAGRVRLVATPAPRTHQAPSSLALRGTARRHGAVCLHVGCRLLGGTIRGPYVRAGRFAAFTVRSLVRPGVLHTVVVVVDARHRIVRSVDAAQDNGRNVGVPRIVLKPHGAVAWLSCSGAGRRCAGPKADEVHVHDVHGLRILSIAHHRVTPTLLRLDGSTLTYEVAGAQLHAAIA